MDHFDFGTLLALAATIFVALSVVAMLMIPCFYFFRGWKLKVLPAVGTSALAIAAVILGLMAFTRWALYTGGGRRPPGLSEWFEFIVINAILAAVAAVPGGFLGLALGWAIKRKTATRAVRSPGIEGEQTRKAQE